MYVVIFLFVYATFQNMEFEECDTHHSGRNDGGQLRQGLPPTPPSSAGSDSEGAASVSCSPERRDSRNLTHQQNIRGLLGPRLYVTNGGHSHITRQPIHTSLISTQPVKDLMKLKQLNIEKSNK